VLDRRANLHPNQGVLRVSLRARRERLDGRHDAFFAGREQFERLPWGLRPLARLGPLLDVHHVAPDQGDVAPRPFRGDGLAQHRKHEHFAIDCEAAAVVQGDQRARAVEVVGFIR